MKNNIYEAMPVDGAYVKALVDLVNACQTMKVRIDKVHFFQNGWHVTFVGYDGADAVCHDGSKGSPCYTIFNPEKAHLNDWTRESKWETIGFPWDNDDVSVLTVSELAYYLRALNEGKVVWDEYNEDC